MTTRQRIYYWIHHTGLAGGNTGVQRHVRALGAGLFANQDLELIPVRWCGERQAIVRAERPWVDGLSQFNGPLLPEPVEAGEALHLTAVDRDQLDGAWLLIAEVTHLPGPPHVPNARLALALDYARYYRLRSAVVFHDIIPIRVPGYESMIPEHALYAQALLGADLILPASRTSGDDLKAWWTEQGYDRDRFPAMRPVHHPAEIPGIPRVTEAPAPRGPGLRMAAWGTVLHRKNQLALMRAFNGLRRKHRDLDLQLDIVGSIDSAVAADVDTQVAASEGTIRLHGNAPDAELRRLAQDCDATAFLSFFEGYGLPLVESMWLGRPCITSNVGSMGELAVGGGCLAVDPYDDGAIEAALESLAFDLELRQRLTAEAISRPLYSAVDFAKVVFDEMCRRPLLANFSIIEGSRGGAGDLAAAFANAGIAIRTLRWRSDTNSILPGLRDDLSTENGSGYGDLRGAWAVLPMQTARNLAEVMQIEDELRGRGARLAVWVDPSRQVDPGLVRGLATTDLVIFASEAARDAALAEALRTLERTTTVRYRYRFASDSAGIIAVLAQERDRTVTPTLLPSISRIYYWCGTIASQDFNSGIQRSTRLIATTFGAMGIDVIPVKWDAEASCLAMLNDEEQRTLALWHGPAPRKPEALPADLNGEWMLVWEIPLPLQPPGSNPAKLAKSLGMRVAAVCHDMIPHKMPDLYSREARAAMAEYWEMFSHVDVILANSWTTAGDIRRYMADAGLGISNLVACPQAGDLPGIPRVQTRRAPRGKGDVLRLLAVGTWEPRKNYPRLIRAVAQAQNSMPDRQITLSIVGRSAGYDAMEAEARDLISKADGIRLLGHVSDNELEELYQNSDATVYASWEEGFGLPVLESLWRGLPCICHDGSAIAEVSHDGGTLPVNMLDDAAIARGIVLLARDDELYDRLCNEALGRPIRAWADCARDVLLAMRRTEAVPGWPLPAILTPGRHPLLTCAISTYNRAGWLRHSLDRLIEATRPWRDSIEVVVCDNASVDTTPDVVARHMGTAGFTAKRNDVNVGMLGNLGMTVRASSGEFIWILGDDDLIIDGTIEKVLTGIERHRDVEMAYMNYSYTRFDTPEEISDVTRVVSDATPIGYGGPNRRVDRLREVAGYNENQFTAIYACAFRADHAYRAYQQDTRGQPFSSMLTCIPTSVYALSVLADRPAWWVGEPAVVVNMNVSWLRWSLLWHLERMHDLFDLSELKGVDPVRLDRYRLHHVGQAGRWVRMAMFAAEDVIRERVSVDRFLERAKHIESFRPQIPLVYAAYSEAWAAGRVLVDRYGPDELFARHGLLEIAKAYKTDEKLEVVNALYRIILGRDADEGGKRAHADLLQRGETPEEIARRMIVSEEFRLHGGASGLLARLGT